MTPAQHDLLIQIALIVHSMAAPDDQRYIDFKITALQTEADELESKEGRG